MFPPCLVTRNHYVNHRPFRWTRPPLNLKRIYWNGTRDVCLLTVSHLRSARWGEENKNELAVISGTSQEDNLCITSWISLRIQSIYSKNGNFPFTNETPFSSTWASLNPLDRDLKPSYSAHTFQHSRSSRGPYMRTSFWDRVSLEGIIQE